MSDGIRIVTDREQLRAIGEIKDNALIEGDCLEVMQYIPTGSIDMILCDLPYG